MLAIADIDPRCTAQPSPFAVRNRDPPSRSEFHILNQ